MSLTYLELVNKLRNKFNEVAITTDTWGSTVGFDQFSKEAINYAYHDILNAEMQWPFLHQQGLLLTVPGIQFYSPNFTSLTIKELDWESFFISNNETVTTISNELQTIPSGGKVVVTNSSTWQSDLGVAYNVGGVAFTAVTGDPLVGQYSILAGNYLFNTADVGQVVKISYLTAAAASEAAVINPKHLAYIDYDLWRQAYLATDMGALLTAQRAPERIFKTNNFGEIGLTPVPDKIYKIIFEYWIDGADMTNTTDVPLIPDRYEQIIIEGASKYCYEFREDQPLAQQADKRFTAGIGRMRIELINRDNTMQAGIYWYPHGHSSSTYTF